MIENLSHLALQQYWWVIVSLLGGLLVFLFFVQGGQTLLNTIGKTEEEKSILVNIIGRKWEITFTTLVTFGGAAFAAFPLFYSTSFGGAYWVSMLDPKASKRRVLGLDIDTFLFYYPSGFI